MTTTGTVALRFRIYREVFVLQFFRDALRLFHLDLFRCRVERVVSVAALSGPAHVSCGMGEWDARLWQANEFDRLLCRDGERQRLGISQADVFARKDDDAPRYEAK